MRGYKKKSENVTKTLKRGKRKEKRGKNYIRNYVQGLKIFFTAFLY